MVTVGDYLFLRPEDVGERIATCEYVKVLATDARMTMTGPVDPSSDVGADLYFRVYTALAATRVVSAQEATGRRHGKLVRRGVAVKLPGGMAIGQVVDAMQGHLVVNLAGRDEAVSTDDVVMIVPAVLCIVLADQASVVKPWGESDLVKVVSAVEAVLDEAAQRGSAEPTVLTLVSAIPGASATDRNAVVRWMNELTGTWNYTTVGHAIRFAWYHRDCRAAGADGSGIGKTISDDPLATNAPAGGRERAGGDVVGGTRGFYDDEDEDVDVWVGPARSVFDVATPSNERAGGATRTEQQVLKDMNGDAGQLRAYFAGRQFATAEATAKPGRSEFRPSKPAIDAHGLTTAQAHAGKNPVTFCATVKAEPDLDFDRPPSVLMRLYDLAFGELQLMHFREYTHEDELAARKGGRDLAVNGPTLPEASISAAHRIQRIGASSREPPTTLSDTRHLRVTGSRSRWPRRWKST
jgi:hypothetical protein